MQHFFFQCCTENWDLFSFVHMWFQKETVASSFFYLLRFLHAIPLYPKQMLYLPLKSNIFKFIIMWNSGAILSWPIPITLKSMDKISSLHETPKYISTGILNLQLFVLTEWLPTGQANKDYHGVHHGRTGVLVLKVLSFSQPINLSAILNISFPFLSQFLLPTYRMCLTNRKWTYVQISKIL